MKNRRHQLFSNFSEFFPSENFNYNLCGDRTHLGQFRFFLNIMNTFCPITIMIHSLHESCPPLPLEFFLEHSVARFVFYLNFKFATFLDTVGVTLDRSLYHVRQGRYGVKE